MKVLRLNAALSTAFLAFLPCLHSSANALEPDYPCFMITQSGKTLNLTNSICAFKKLPATAPAFSANRDQEFVGGYNSDEEYPEETEPEASEEIQAAQIEETSERVDAINADE